MKVRAGLFLNHLQIDDQNCTRRVRDWKFEVLVLNDCFHRYQTFAAAATYVSRADFAVVDHSPIAEAREIHARIFTLIGSEEASIKVNAS
jgi:hypothetical protein